MLTPPQTEAMHTGVWMSSEMLFSFSNMHKMHQYIFMHFLHRSMHLPSVNCFKTLHVQLSFINTLTSYF